MDVTALKSKIISNKIPSYLIFTGAEWKVQEIYIHQISKVTGKSIKRVNSISDIYSKLKNTSFIQTSYIYIVRDDKELITNEKLQGQIDNNLLGDNILIHLVTTVDKRLKFYKVYKDTIIEFNPLKPDILKKYIQKEVDLSDRNCDILMDVCEYDYGRCLLEIDKIRRFNDWNINLTPDDCFKILLKEGTIYEPPYDAVFDCVDAILKRQPRLSFDLLNQSYKSGEATMVLLTVLYNNAKAVLQVQSCSSKDIAKSTGLTGWQIKNALDKKGKYTNEELMYLLHLIQKVEEGIKTGTIDEQIAMEYILVHIL